MSVIAWVFARGGSKSLPRKNLRLLAGKPLLGHAIEAAQAATLVDAVIVSTDDEEIAETARCWGAEVLMRPAELATDEAPEWLSWRHAVTNRSMAASDVFVSVPCTSPLRLPADIDATIRTLHDSDADAAITVHTAPCHPWWDMMEMNSGGYVRLMVPTVPGERELVRRQDVPTVYVQNDVAHAARPAYILAAESEFHGRVRGVVIPEERALDIHTEHDLMVAEVLYAHPSRFEAGKDVTHLARSTKDPGAVVSVHFTAADMDLIGRAAEATRVPMVRYIHDAALGASVQDDVSLWRWDEDRA